MITKLKTVLFGTATLAMLGGCGTLTQANNQSITEDIVRDTVESNDAYTRATSAIILKNILRARDRWPRGYTTLSGISTEPTNALNVAPGLSLRGDAGDLLPYKVTPGNVTRNTSTKKSYQVNPLAERARSESILTSISPTTFTGYYESWPKDVALLLFAKGLKNGDDLILNAGDDNAAFRTRILNALNASPASVAKGKTLTTLDFKNDFEFVSGSESTDKSCSTQMLNISTLLASGKEVSNLKDFVELTKASVSFSGGDKGNVTVELCKQGTVSKVLKHKKVPDVEFKIVLRSFEDMIYYVGETLREGSDVSAPTVISECKTPGPLFAVEDGAKGHYAVTVDHAGETYSAIPIQGCAGNRTSTVLSLLNELLLLNQSDEFLKAPDIINR